MLYEQGEDVPPCPARIRVSMAFAHKLPALMDRTSIGAMPSSKSTPLPMILKTFYPIRQRYWPPPPARMWDGNAHRRHLTNRPGHPSSSPTAHGRLLRPPRHRQWSRSMVVIPLQASMPPPSLTRARRSSSPVGLLPVVDTQSHGHASQARRHAKGKGGPFRPPFRRVETPKDRFEPQAASRNRTSTWTSMAAPG